jgi:hypothetical protein
MMPSERDIELAHPEAFDFAFGNLAPDKRAEFDRHLGDCHYCQGVVDEYSEIGRIVQNLPPHVEPPADLENRVVAAMASRVHRSAEPQTQVRPRPPLQPPAADQTWPRPSPVSQPAPAEPRARAMVTHLPAWRSRRGLAAVAAAAAIVIAAIVVPLSLGGGLGTPAQASVAIPLHATAAAKVIGYGAATGRATARQDASGSWDITLTVQHLKHFDPQPWYGCWYVSRDGRQVASAGTFLVGPSGSGTFSMTSAVDPRDFSTMEITIQQPSRNGAVAGTVILIGQTL